MSNNKRNNKSLKSKINKKNSTIVTSSIIASSLAAAAIGVGVSQSQQNQIDSNSNLHQNAQPTTPKTPQHGGTKVVSFKSSELIFPNVGNLQNVGSFYEVEKTQTTTGTNPTTTVTNHDTKDKYISFYTTFEFLREYQKLKLSGSSSNVDLTTLYTNLFNSLPENRVVRINSEDFRIGDYQFESYQSSTQRVVLTKKSNNTEKIELEDETLYYPSNISIGDTLKENGEFKQVKNYSEFLVSLFSDKDDNDNRYDRWNATNPSVTDEEKKKLQALDSKFVKVDDKTFSKIRGFISTSLPVGISDVSIAKFNETIDGIKKTFLIVSGVDANNKRLVYTIDNLPIVYTYEQLKSELPSYDEVVARDDMDYVKAIVQKAQSLTTTNVFDNKIPKTSVTESNVKITDDGTIEIKENDDNIIYITQGNEGFVYHTLDRSLTAQNNTEYPYTWDMVDFESMLRIVTNKGQQKDNAIPLATVYTNKLFNSFLTKNAYVSAQGTIYYVQEQNALYIVDNSGGAKKALKVANLPRVLRSDAKFLFDNNADATTKSLYDNKELYKVEYLAQALDYNADSNDSYEYDSLQTQIKDVIKDNLNKAKNNNNTKIGFYNISSANDFSVSTESDITNVFGNNSGYKYYRITNGNNADDYYVINANEVKAINANKLIFKDKQNYDQRQRGVSSSYTIVNDVGLVDLNNYLDTTYPTTNNQTPDFAKTTSRITRALRSGGDRFVIYNSSKPQITSKTLILFGLPQVLSTDDAFNNFSTEITIEKYVQKVVEDHTTNQQTTKTPKDILIEMLNPLLKRVATDNNKALVAGNEYNFTPENTSSPGDVKIDFDQNQNRRLINLVDIKNQQGSSATSNKIVEQIEVRADNVENPNGFIPNVRKVAWAKTDLDSLEFFRMYKNLVDAQPSTFRNNARPKIVTSIILNDPFVKQNAPDIKEGTIEYEFDLGIIRIIDKVNQQAIVFYNVPRITTISDIYDNLDSGLNDFADNLTDQVIKSYATDNTKPSYDQNAFITSLVNAKTTGNIQLSEYSLSKDNKTYTITEKTLNGLDDGPNNSERRYRQFVYEIVESNNQNNKIKIYDNTNYLDVKNAYRTFGNTVSLKHWNDLYKALANANSYQTAIKLVDIQSIAPNFVNKLTSSINQEGLGFVLNPPSNLDQNRYEPKVFIVEKLNNKQLVIAGWRYNNADSSAANFSILTINGLPNIVEENNATFTLPTTDQIVNFNGNYDLALKESLKNLLVSQQNQTLQTYNLPTPYTKDNNGDLLLSSGNLRFEIAKFQAPNTPITSNTYVNSLDDHGTFIKLYKGSSASYGSLTIFLDNKKTQEIIGSDYSKKQDHNKTLEFFESFSANSTLDQQRKIALIQELVNFQNQSDAKFREFNFNVSSTSGVDILYDQNKLVLYENFADKSNSRVAIIYNVQKVISTYDIIDSNTEELYKQVLKNPYYGDIHKLIADKLKTPNNLLKTQKLFGFYTYDTNTNPPLVYNKENNIITYANNVINVVHKDIFIVKPNKVFVDPTRFKNLVTNLTNYTENNYDDYTTKSSEPDVIAATNLITQDNVSVSKIFKIGTKMIFVGTKDSKPTYVLFIGSPEFTTDVSENINWLNVYQAIGYTSAQTNFSTNNLDDLVKEALKTKLKQGSNNILHIANKDYDISAISITYKRQGDAVTIVNINQNGLLDIIVENTVSTLDSASIDTKMQLNNLVNINKITSIIRNIKTASKTQVSSYNNTNINVVNYNDINGIDEIKPNNDNYDQLYLDEQNQVLWFINSSTNKAFALTNVPDVVDIYMDELISPTPPNNQKQYKNEWFTSQQLLKTASLSATEVLDAYVRDVLTKTVISSITINGSPTINTFDNATYMIGYGDVRPKRLVVYDKSTYFLSQNNSAANAGINASITFSDVQAFKTLYDELVDDEYVDYSTKTANTQLDNKITELSLDKANVKLLRTLYQTKPVVLLQAQKDGYTVYHLIYNLPKVAQPSKVKIPSVYSFVKYTKDNDGLRFENAIKNELDTSNNKANINVDLFGINVPWNEVTVSIDRTTKTIRVSKTDDRNVFDNKTFDFIPDFKTTSIRSATNEEQYELIKLVSQLQTDSTLDSSLENEINNSKRPQKQLTDELFNNQLITSKINEAQLQNIFNLQNKDKISIEYHLDSRLGDRFILRYFDDTKNNAITNVLLIENVKRIVKLTDITNDISVSEDEFIASIINHSDAAKVVEDKLRAKTNNNTNTKLNDLYEFSASLSVKQLNANYLVSDNNSLFSSITILNDVEYLSTAASTFDNVFAIKKYKEAYDSIKGSNTTPVALNTLNNNELNTIVNDFSTFEPNNTNVVLKTINLSTDTNNPNNVEVFVFKQDNKVLVANNLPIIYTATKNTSPTENTKTITFDKIVENISESKSILNIYNDFFKDSQNYSEQDGYITITQNEPQQSTKLKKDTLTLSFNNDGVLELSAKEESKLSHQTIVYLILEEKNEEDNITTINANFFDNNDVYEFIKLIEPQPQAGSQPQQPGVEIDVSDEMKNSMFITRNNLLPSNFFGTADSVKVKYLLEQNKIVLTNTNTNKSVIYYNIARVVEAQQAYSVDEVVNSDKQVQAFLKEKLNDTAQNNPLTWGKYSVNKGADVNVSNIGSNNDSAITTPNDANKIQVVVLDNTIYHLGFEKISAKNEFANVIAFDNYQKTLTSNDFVDISTTITNDKPFPNELRRVVFNASYGNIDFSTAKIKKIPGTATGDQNTNTDLTAKLIIIGENQTTSQKHVIVVYEFPEVYNPTSDNDVPAPSVRQLASVDGLEQSQYFSAEDILNNALKNVLTDASGNLLRTNGFAANSSEIALKRPTQDQEDIASNYSYTITSNGQTKALVPKDKVPNVYGYDSLRYNNQSDAAKNVLLFEKKYNELLATSQNGKVLWSSIKDERILQLFITSTNTPVVDATLKANLADNAKVNDTYVLFDKESNRILILDETDNYIAIFGNIHKVVDLQSALPTPLYSHYDVVLNDNNLQNTILQKVNTLGSQKQDQSNNTVTLNGYNFKKNFSADRINNGVYSYIDRSQQELYFVDETIYEVRDFRNHNFNNLVEFYNKTFVYLRSQTQGLEVLSNDNNVSNSDLDSIVTMLNLQTQEQPKILLSNNKLAIVGIDNSSNTKKVYVLRVPTIRTLDQDLSSDEIANATGSSLEEKVANAVKQKLRQSSTNPNIEIDGQQYNLDDPTLSFVAKQDPSDATKQIVEIVKDGVVIATYTMNASLPTIKVAQWSQLNATPLQTWFYLYSIAKNPVVDNSKPNQKSITSTNLQFNDEQTLFSIDFMNAYLSDSNNGVEEIKNNPGKSIEYDKDKNQIVLRAGSATLIFANVSKVINASYKPTIVDPNRPDAWIELYNPHNAYLNTQDISIESKNPINSINRYFNGLLVNPSKNTKLLDDKVNSYDLASNANVVDETQIYKDAFTYKFTANNDSVYIVDSRLYEVNETSGRNDFEQNIKEYNRIKDIIKEDSYVSVASLNSPTISNYANSYELINAYIIKQQHQNKTVFIVVGDKEITRKQKTDTKDVNELVRSIFIIKDLPEIPNLDQINARLPSEQEIIDNGGDYASLIKNRLEDPSVFSQSGNPPSINFGGILLNTPINEVIANDDGSIKIVDANGKIVIIPPKENQIIYKEYELSPYAEDPRNDDVDFRFTNIVEAKKLYDLIDSKQPTQNQTRALDDEIKNNPLLKKIIDNYNNLFYNPSQNKEWDLTNATIVYNRENNSIVIKDNADQQTTSPRVLILKNAPRIIYAKDLSRTQNDYFIEMSALNNSLVEFIKQKISLITSNTNVSSYSIGNNTPNQHQTRSSYDMMNDLSVDETPYIDNLNTYVINFKDVRNKKDTDIIDKLYVVDFAEFTSPIASDFNDKAALFEQLSSLQKDRLIDATTINNNELQDKIKEALGIDSIDDKVQTIIAGNKMIVQQKDENGNIIKSSIIQLPVLISQIDAKLPSKEDVIASDLSVEELVINNFNNPTLFTKNQNNEISVGSLVFNPNDVDLEIDENGIISIFKKNSDPKQLLGTIIANNPVIPQRKIIDNHEQLYKLERNPYEIYDLISIIHRLPSNVNSFIRLTDEMKDINFLKAKLNSAYADDLNWYKNEETTIMYDIQTNSLIIDNNKQTNNKILVIKNVDRVLRANDRTYKLYNVNDIVLGYNTINANAFKQDSIMHSEIILNAIARALIKVDFEHTINNYSITLKNKNNVSLDDLVYVEDDSLKLPNDNPQWRKYIKLSTADNDYVILDDTYYHFSKLNAKETFNDNPSFKLLFDAIIRANQRLIISDEVYQNTPKLEDWINDIRQNDAFFNLNNELTISFASGPNLVITTKDDKYLYVAMINDIPTVVNEKDIGLKLPTENDVISSDGSYAQAIKNKLQDVKQFPIDADGKITLNNQKIDPNDIDVIVNEDGTIEIYTDAGERIVISISPTNQPPAFNVVNAKLDDAIIARQLYDLIKKTQALQNNFPHQKAMDDKLQSDEDKLINNQWISKNIIEVYSQPNNIANINTDFSKWTVEYDSVNDKLLFRGRNTDESRRAQVLVVNDVIKVIWASSLYSSKEVLDKHSNTISLQDARDAVINSKLQGLMQLGEYTITANTTIDSQFYDNSSYNALDASYKTQYQQLISNNNKIVIIDNVNYLQTKVGYELFSDYDAFAEIQKELQLNLNALVPIYPQQNQTDNDLPLNQQLVDDMLSVGSSLDNIKKSGQVIKTSDYLMVLGVDKNNQPFVYKITDLPNVVLRSQIPYVSVDDMIKADGDRAKAVELLLNDAKRFAQKDGKISLNGQELLLANLAYEVDENNNVSIYEKDANGNLIKPAKAILIAKSDSSDVVNDPIIYKDDTSRFFASYVQEIISAIYSVDENKQTNSIKLLKEVANNQVVLDLIKGRFELNDEATIEFKKDEQQLIIRNNDQQYPKVIIVSTKSILNSTLDQIDLVKYNPQKDYWLIWVSIASILGGFGIILLLSVFVYQITKKKRIKTTK